MSKPIKRLSENGISTAVFEKETNNGDTMKIVVTQRSWKDSEDNWQNTNFIPVGPKLKIAIEQLQEVYDEFVLAKEEAVVGAPAPAQPPPVH